MGQRVSTTKKTVFRVNTHLVEASQGESILEACLRAGVAVEHSCGGMGSCGTCRVFVTQGLDTLDARNELESEMAVDRDFPAHERLSCQTIPVDGLRVVTTDTSVSAKAEE